MEFLDGSWKKEVSSWDALMGEELLNQEAILEGAIHSIRNMGDVAFVIIRRREWEPLQFPPCFSQFLEWTAGSGWQFCGQSFQPLMFTILLLVLSSIWWTKGKE